MCVCVLQWTGTPSWAKPALCSVPSGTGFGSLHHPEQDKRLSNMNDDNNISIFFRQDSEQLNHLNGSVAEKKKTMINFSVFLPGVWVPRRIIICKYQHVKKAAIYSHGAEIWIGHLKIIDRHKFSELRW